MRHSAEKFHLDHSGVALVHLRESLERFMNRQSFQPFLRRGVGISERYAHVSASAFLGQSCAGMVYKDPAHDLCGYRHKMSVPLPAISPLTGKPQEGFVHQGGSLKAVSGALTPHVGSGQAPKFRIDPLHQAHLGFRISLTH
jgi:hypothetical protein